MVDSMVPIGRGQRGLIIGDRQTGKTAWQSTQLLTNVIQVLNVSMSRLVKKRRLLP